MRVARVAAAAVVLLLGCRDRGSDGSASDSVPGPSDSAPVVDDSDPPSPTCSAETCDGCCLEDGSCSTGLTDQACGAGGDACMACDAVGETCDDSVCVNDAVADNGLVDDSTLHVTTLVEAEIVRADLIDFIWGDAGYPDEVQPTDVTEDTSNPLPGVLYLERVDRLSMDLGDGFMSVAYAFLPADPNGRLVLLHQGHADGLDEAGLDTAVAYLVPRGYTVITLFMPLYGENTGPVASHDALMAMDGLAYHPLRYFLEPSIVALNYALDNYGILDAAMMGISGGGWTTTLVAALDDRVRQSFPVAGSLPLYLREEGEEGDREQYDLQFYRLAGYLDLYAMAAAGSGRNQLQVLNRYDACCFDGLRFEDYAETISDVAPPMGGTWEVFVDESHHDHLISEHALEASVIHTLENDGVMMVDNLDPGWGSFQSTGNWTARTDQGYGGDTQAAAAGSGESTATWLFTVPPGRYAVYATWTAAEGQATDATYHVAVDDLSEDVSLDQTRAPDDLTASGGDWELLTLFATTKGDVQVTLTNDAGGDVIADAIRIQTDIE